MKYFRTLPTAVIALTLILTTGLAFAGWGDALKAAGKAGAEAAGLSSLTDKAETAVREVLTLGKDYAIETLGKDGGFSDNVYAAISLPDSVSTLATMSGLTSILNSAAETAVPALDTAFSQSIEDLDLSDPSTLLTSAKSDTGVTDYFDTESRSSLKELARPIVETALADAGLSSYSTALSVITKTTGFDPLDYTTEQILDAMFHFMGEKEKDLRATGAEQASELLQTFF